jgi:alpha-beta hydrolase superfamily lysophospholipase
MLQTPVVTPAGNGAVAHESWIEGAAGRLCRRWERPVNVSPVARMLIFHGYGDHSGRFAHFKRWLAARGVASDAFDFRGHGCSGGKRGFVRKWDEYLDDVQAILAASRPVWASEGLAGLPLFVLGHSHGGLILAAAGIRGILKPDEVTGCIMSAPYLRPAQALTWPWRVIAAVTNVVSPSLRVATGLSPEMMSGDPAMISDSEADTLLLRAATPRWYTTALRAQAEVFAHADRFRLPLLCLFGDEDRVASVDGARRFVERTGSIDKTFQLILGARHELLRETSRDDTFARILRWMSLRMDGRSTSDGASR